MARVQLQCRVLPTQVVGAEMGHWLLKENVHKHRVRRVGEEPSKQGLSTHWFSKSTEYTRETGMGVLIFISI